MDVSIEKLKNYHLLQGLDDEALTQVAAKFKLRQVAAKDLFIQANEESFSIYLIVEGSVSVEVDTPVASSEQLAKFGKGQSVGEFILAKEARRSASVRAVTNLTLYETTRDQLLELFEQHPRIGYLVYQNLSELLVDRIRDTNMLARNALGVIAQQI